MYIDINGQCLTKHGHSFVQECENKINEFVKSNNIDELNKKQISEILDIDCEIKMVNGRLVYPHWIYECNFIFDKEE